MLFPGLGGPMPVNSDFFADAFRDYRFSRENYHKGFPLKTSSQGQQWGGHDIHEQTSILVDPYPDIDDVYFNFTAGKIRITRGYGIWALGQRVNPIWWGSDLTNAVWIKTDAPTIVQNATDIFLKANGCSSLTLTGTSATVMQAVTLASQTQKPQAFLRYRSGTPQVEYTLDGGTTWVDVSSQVAPAGAVLGKGRIKGLAATVLTNPSVGLRVTGAPGDAIDVQGLGCQYGPAGQAATYDTIPVLTVGAAFTRFNYQPVWGSNDKLRTTCGLYDVMQEMYHKGGPGTVRVEARGDNPGTAAILVNDFNPQVALMNVTNAIALSAQMGQIATTANTGVLGLENKNICVVSWDEGGGSVCLNGGTEVQLTRTGSPAFYYNGETGGGWHQGLGNNTGGSARLDGCVQRVTYWRKRLAPGEAQRYSRLDHDRWAA